jgi:hypothetical protein
LLVHSWRSGHDVRLLRKTIHQRTPVLDAITLNAKQVDVRSRTEKTILQILAESIVDGERNDERCYAGGNR